jgi:hypothetical protein
MPILKQKEYLVVYLYLYYLSRSVKGRASRIKRIFFTLYFTPPSLSSPISRFKSMTCEGTVHKRRLQINGREGQNFLGICQRIKVKKITTGKGSKKGKKFGRPLWMVSWCKLFRKCGNINLYNFSLIQC